MLLDIIFNFVLFFRSPKTMATETTVGAVKIVGYLEKKGKLVSYNKCKIIYIISIVIFRLLFRILDVIKLRYDFRKLLQHGKNIGLFWKVDCCYTIGN